MWVVPKGRILTNPIVGYKCFFPCAVKSGQLMSNRWGVIFKLSSLFVAWVYRKELSTRVNWIRQFLYFDSSKVFTRSKAKLASTLEPAEVLESLQISDEESGNAISHGGPKSTQNSVSFSHTCSTQHAQVVSDTEYLGFDHGPHTSDSPINEVPTRDTDQVAKLLSDHTKELAVPLGCSIGDPNERI